MPKDHQVYLQDIIEATNKIEKYTKNLAFTEFTKNELIIDAVVRNLEIIGEATKRIPNQTKEQASNIEWKKIAGLRDILIHEYFGIDLEIIWDIIKNKLPDLRKEVTRITKNKQKTRPHTSTK